MTDTVKTYAAARRLKIGDEYREGPRFKHDPVEVEHLVPEAHLWPKHESLLHTGMIKEVEVPVEDLFAAFELRQVSSSDALAILERLGLAEGVDATGAHSSPRRPGPAPSRKREQQDLAPDRVGGPGSLRRRTRPVAAKKVPAAKKAAPAKRTVKAVPKKTTTSTKRAGTAMKVPLHEEVE